MLPKFVSTFLDDSSSFTSSAIITMLFRVLGAVLVFFLQILLARFLGVNEYGIYTFVIGCISIIILFCTLGFDTSLARFIPEYIQAKQWSFFHGITKYASRVSLVVSLLAMAITFSATFMFESFESRSALILALPLIVIVVMTNIRVASLRSMQCYVKALLPETVLKPFIFILLLSAAYLLGGPLDSSDAFIFQIGSAGMSFIVGGYFLKKTIKANIPVAEPVYKEKYWLLSSLPMLMITGSTFVISQTDIVMLGALKNFSYSGVYGAVSKVAGVSVFFMAALNFVVGPMISKTYHGEDRVQLHKLVLKCTRWSFLLALLSFLVCGLFGQYILGLFGEEFVAGYYALIILLLGHLFNTASGPVGLLLSLTGNQSFASKVMIVSASINIALNFYLIPSYGLLGAAFSTMLTTASWNFIMLLKVKRELGINSSILGKRIDEKS